MVSSNVWKKHFKQIDRDQDGRVYIEEVQKYLKKELSTMTVDRVRYLAVLGGAASADYEGQKGVENRRNYHHIHQAKGNVEVLIEVGTLNHRLLIM